MSAKSERPNRARSRRRRATRRSWSEGFEHSAGEEGVVAFDRFFNVATEETATEAFTFGSAGNGTKCPHAKATTPTIEVGATRVSELTPGEKARLSSEVTTADVMHVEWRFEDLTTGTSEPSVATTCPHEKHVGEADECTQGEENGQVSVEHAFKAQGEYRITEVIETDDLASPKIEVAREVPIGLKPPEVELAAPSVLTTGQAGKFEATVVDPNEATPHLTYVWKFGDGTESRDGPTTETAITTEHTYVTSCALCTVTLEVKDEAGARGEANAEVAVREPEGGPPPTTTSTPAPTPATTSTTTTTGTSPGHGVEAFTSKAIPEARLASTSLSVSPKGALTVKVSCPSDETSCAGTITLSTLTAVVARVPAPAGGAAVAAKSKKSKKVILTLATGSFSVSGGHVKAITLHLSTKARALLAHSHVLRARINLVAHDPAKATHTTQQVVTLRLTKR